MNKKNNFIKLTSVLLSLCLILAMLTSVAPASTLAFSEQGTVPDDSSGFDFVLEEDTTLRDAFSKHYIDPNGKRYAVIFPEQVHYKEGETWVEIDNSLQYDASKDVFVSQNNMFVSAFAKTANDNCLATISDGDYQLSWSIDFDSVIIAPDNQLESAAKANSNVQDVNAQITSAVQNDSSTVKSRENISDIGKAISGVTYKGICDFVDLRYTVLHGKLEEDIILNSPDALSSYTLRINAGGLIAVKHTDNSISFIDEDENVVFSLAAPWMKDSDVSVTDSIDVEVSQTGNIIYVKYTPDNEWLTDESRVFPVLIDPSFSTRYYTNNYYDTYVYEGDSASSTRPTETTMKVGNISGKNYYSYIKILNFPDLVGGFNVDEASFDFWVNTTSSPALNLYQVNSSWSQNSITYNNQPSSTLIKNNVTGTANGTNSKYSIDITSWFENLQYSWPNVSDFFKSSSWNGFKIAYTNSVSGNYTQIYSSENTSVSYRPVLTIQYTYWPYGGIEDGAVYSFVNKSSGKYLTVDGGNTSNGTNVYQYAKNDSLSQAFRLYYEEDDNCFRIRAMCSSNGYGSVLEVPSFSGTIDNSTGYTNSNVRLYSYGSSYPNDQEWIVYPYEYSDYYMVVLRADPNLALTSYGSGNGTSNGTSSTSTGNVFVSQFTGSDNQLWKLESGGIQLINARNIKEESGSQNIGENKTWLSFCCPVTEYGDSVSWGSSNTYSATVDGIGHVTTHSAGIAVISATITHADSSTDLYSVTVYVIIEDGTYYFNDKADNQRRLEYEAPNNGLLENAVLESFGTNYNSEPTQRYQFFKVKYLGSGLYSVRSMLDCAMGWTRSNSSLVMTTIGTSNSTVPSTAKWRIKTDVNGYYIHAYYGTSKTVTAGSSSGADITLGSYSSSNLREHWTIRKISAQYHGVTIKASTDELEVGDSFTFTAVVYSTFTDVYGQNGITWSRTNGTGSATINSSTGQLTGTSKGTVTVTAKYIVNSYTQWTAQQEVLIYKKAIILLPGIMGSTIYSNGLTINYNNSNYQFSNNSILWDPDLSLNTGKMNASVRALACNSSGTPSYSTGVRSPIVNNNKNNYRKYGAQNIYENLYMKLYNSFYNDYDVILFEYDWRKDPFDTAQDLDDYISSNYYSQIVLIAHSMGGNVSSYYLSLGAEQRSKVEKHITIGTPFLGAEKLAYVYDTGDAIDYVIIIDWFDLLLGSSVKAIMPNIPAIYSLLPVSWNFNPYLKIEDANNNITTVQTYTATINEFSSNLSNWNSNLYNSAVFHQAALFVNGQHVTQLVDSYYIIGDGTSTPLFLKMKTDSNNQKLGDLTIESTNNDGDGTVSIHSSTINGTLTNHTLYKYQSSSVNADHIGLIKGEDDQKSFDYICDVINGINVDSYNDTTFFSKYSGYKTRH